MKLVWSENNTVRVWSGHVEEAPFEWTCYNILRRGDFSAYFYELRAVRYENGRIQESRMVETGVALEQLKEKAQMDFDQLYGLEVLAKMGDGGEG